MKNIILKKYEELKNSKEDNKKEILAVIQKDTERSNKALREVYKIFSDEIESYIEDLITLTVAYILVEEV
ncbi:hypothetical protein CF076_14900 [Clostridium botulinum]|uniref:hypothetical protein n=1 Tax=Clostridium botulinum TaxID=1491 RepID=UPI000466E597|nr:hypothetical protein [Clostridium botulinum]MBN3352003.1 hypothetical protein [Clostridium botulinum]